MTAVEAPLLALWFGISRVLDESLRSLINLYQYYLCRYLHKYIPRSTCSNNFTQAVNISRAMTDSVITKVEQNSICMTTQCHVNGAYTGFPQKSDNKIP